MAKYCWDGTTSEPDPNIQMYNGFELVDLPLRLEPGVGYVEWNRTHPFAV